MPRADRTALADLLLSAGPDAPTLDEGWLTRDLVVHLLVREGRPDVLGARAGARLARSTAGEQLRAHADRVEGQLRAQAYEQLVERFRAGPPRWSPFALPGAESLANGVEFYVHGEDVRRAARGWDPDQPQPPLRPGQREALWKALRRQARLLYRRSPVGVVLVVPAGPRTVALRREEQVVVTGQPEELLLHAFGRTSVAQVEVTGTPSAVAAFGATPLGV